MVHFLLLVAGLMMAGCYSTGNADIKNKDLINQVQVGKSTKEDVRKLLGEPYSVSKGHLAESMPGHATFTMTMDEWWTYFYSKHHQGATTFIPYIGWLIGERKDEWAHFAVGFDAKGTVQHVSSGGTKKEGSLLDEMKR